jgi:hypothetical protein
VWNSLLEATSSGVPVLTCPLVFEHFIYERLPVEVNGWGVRVWEGGTRGWKQEAKDVVPREAIANTMFKFMEAGGNCNKVHAKA